MRGSCLRLALCVPDFGEPAARDSGAGNDDALSPAVLGPEVRALLNRLPAKKLKKRLEEKRWRFTPILLGGAIVIDDFPQAEVRSEYRAADLINVREKGTTKNRKAT